MEFKFMKNPQILNFLNQYSKKEWDSIIEDLLLYGINKVNDIEKNETPKKEEKINSPKKANKISEIISFKNCKYTPYECATNMIIENAEFRYNKDNNDKTFKKLNELDKQINRIKNKSKNKKVSSKKVK